MSECMAAWWKYGHSYRGKGVVEAVVWEFEWRVGKGLAEARRHAGRGENGRQH